MHNRILSLLILSIGFALNTAAQSWDDIKKNPDYLYGEGWAVTVAEADQAALSDLISKISVTVSSHFETTEEETQMLGNTDSKTYVQSKVKTYSQATLNNTEKLVITNEPDAYVGRWVKRSDLNKLFELRRNKMLDFVRLAEETEQAGKVDDALRYYYWSFVLLKTLQQPSEEKYQNAKGEHMLVNYIPQRMNDIFHNVDVRVTHIDEDNNVQLSITYRGTPVSSMDYTYFDGMDWSAIYSAKDGRGVLELAQNANLNNIQLKLEYEFRSEAHIDREMQSVMDVVKSNAFRKAYLHIDGSASGAMAQNMATSQTTNSQLFSNITGNGGLGKRADTRVTPVANNNASNNETAINQPITPARQSNLPKVSDQNSYCDIVAKVTNAIKTRNYLPVQRYFTADGYTMFNKLIKYGNARLLQTNKPQTFYAYDDKVVCRSIPMSFSFQRGVRKSFVEDVVLTFDESMKICNISFALGEQAENDILYKGTWNEKTRMLIMEFLESYRTAYALKDIDYIERIFDDHAKIIIGRLSKRAGTGSAETGGVALANEYSYTQKDKQQYIRDLKRCFASNEFVNIRFSNNNVRKLQGNEVYGIQVKQDYYSTNYGDTGYLFLLVDFHEADLPQIKVRTWQPEPDPEFGVYGPEMF